MVSQPHCNFSNIDKNRPAERSETAFEHCDDNPYGKVFIILEWKNYVAKHKFLPSFQKRNEKSLKSREVFYK